MNTQALERPAHVAIPLTNAALLARLMDMMLRWWEGQSIAEIGRAHGVSRQRATWILDRVACTQTLRREPVPFGTDSCRCASPERAEFARLALLHPLAWRLTAKQRGALAWQAQGLVMLNIARRMRFSIQSVQYHIASAHRRLLQLAPEASCREAEGSAC